MLLKAVLRRGLREPTRTGTFILAGAVSAAAVGLTVELARNLLWQAFPFASAEQTVLVFATSEVAPETTFPLSPTVVRALRNTPSPFLATASFDSPGKFRPRFDSPREIAAQFVDASLFWVLGVQPQFGRSFSDDDRFGAAGVAVISHDLWTTEYGGAADVLSQSIGTGDAAYSIVGVMPRGFQFPDRQTQAWLLRRAWSAGQATYLVGQLPTIDLADEALARIRREAAAARDPQRAFTLVSLRDYATQPLRRPIALAAGGVALLLALTLFNLIGMRLAAVITRSDQIRLQSALGASVGTVGGTVFAETMMFAAASALTAVTITALAGPVLEETLRRSWVDAVLFERWGIRYVVAASVALVVGGVSGLPAVLVARRTAAQRNLTASWGGAAAVLRAGVTIGQVGCATVLFAAALGFLISVSNLAAVPLGFRPSGVWLVSTRVPMALGASPGPAGRGSPIATLLENVAAAGIADAAVTSSLPFEPNDLRLNIRIPGSPLLLPTVGLEPVPERAGAYFVDTAAVAGDYFRILGIRLLAGRAFDRADAISPVAILDRLLADALFGSVNASLGRTLQLTGTPLTVVGVVEPIRRFQLVRPPAPVLYVPFEQWPTPVFTIVAKPPRVQSMSAMPVAFQRTDPRLRIQSMIPLVARTNRELVVPRAVAVLSGAFGGVGLFVALIGVSTTAVLASSARRREYGIRLALGAQECSILALAMRRGIVLVGAGTLAGAIVWVWGSSAAAVTFFEVDASDLRLVAAAGATCGIVALMGWYIPVRRLAIVDPVEVIRTE
jgi:predicted permease